MAKWQGFYSIAQVSRLAGIPERTLYDWKSRGIIKPSVQVIREGQIADDGYSYADLTIIKIMRALREDRLDLKSVSVALRHLFERLGPPSKGWAESNVYIVGNKVFAEKPDEWDITAATQFGQKAEPILFGDLFKELRAAEEAGSILVPQEFARFVEVNPDVMNGEPVIKDTRVPTSMIAMLISKGRSIDHLVTLYRPIPKEFIEKAVEYERFLDSTSYKTRASTT